MAARPDVIYHLHVIGRYTGHPEDLDDRHYITRALPLAAPTRPEVWIIRGWNHPLLVLAAVLAHFRRVPILMWQERSGATWEASNLKLAARIQLRKLLLPILFLPYCKNTIVLGTGAEAVEEFRRLSHGSPGREFPYPNPIADACLANEGAREKNNGEPLLLFVGSLMRRKAVDQIADACKILWSQGYRCRVRYVGEGPLSRLLEHHLHSSEGRAELYPFADREMLLRHFQEADAVLLPSRHDGWGLPIHEGLASGVPVVTSDACGAADLITRSGCGKVIKAGDKEALAEAMAWVISLAPYQREVIREKALEVARCLTIPALAEVLLSYCSEALTLRGQRWPSPTERRA